MIYMTIDAEDARGKRCEVLVDAANPPRIGDWFKEDGRKLRRLPSIPEARVKRSVSEVTAYQLPRLKDVEKYGYARAPRYNERGFAVFDSRREVNEYVSRHNDNPTHGGTIAWDPDGNE
jgi:hypothetical protein